ncbi:inx [Mytilus edulis]|uniref:Innexin n=1 Tax=Mytilus edulis TaxID=6550 RepID=A0A8S3SA42_MYTED|nr:inx [Mytilus edulis]
MQEESTSARQGFQPLYGMTIVTVQHQKATVYTNVLPFMVHAKIGGALGGLASWSRLTGSADDDWIDRINHIWSVVLLTVFTIIVSSAQYVGDPIHCWMPGEFSFARIAYAKSTCWISNTYYIPMDNTIPEHIEMRQNKEITYYQWIPIILMFMAFLFKVPNIAWRLLNGYSGIDMNKIVSMSNASLMSTPDDRTKNISQIAKYLHRWIECQQDYHSNIFSSYAT